MKALLISESDDMLNSYSAFFKESGYDTVCYRWLLKAMDNIEEIEPQLVFIDGSDYPRHWKALVQHINTSLHRSLPLVFLAAKLSDEEAKKAAHLGVHNIPPSPATEEIRNAIVNVLQLCVSEVVRTEVQAYKNTDEFSLLTETLQQATEISEQPVESFKQPGADAQTKTIETIADSAGTEKDEDEVPFFSNPVQKTAVDFSQAKTNQTFVAVSETMQPVQTATGATKENSVDEIFSAPDGTRNGTENEKCSFVFFHPHSKIAVSGSIRSFNPPLIYFVPDDKTVLQTLRFGQKSVGVLGEKGLVSNVSVQIQGFESDAAELCILK